MRIILFQNTLQAQVMNIHLGFIHHQGRESAPASFNLDKKEATQSNLEESNISQQNYFQ
jgi:hypothetical protein